MFNTRSKIKNTQTTLKASFIQASMEDYDDQSGALIGSNDDLLTEILLRLPAASILRFKSVSKHWRWLLNDRHFTLRFNKLLKSPGIFVRNKYVPFDVENQSPPPFRSLDFHPDPYGIKIIQSCNGLLLCSSYRCKSSDRKYYVFNPTTKQFVIIPSVPAGQNDIHYMGLAFHETECVPYKLVCILYNPVTELFQIQIYSSDIRTWKISIESFPRDWLFFHSGVYWNGAVYWYSSYNYCIHIKVEAERLSHSRLEVEPLPTPFLEHYNGRIPLYFGESRGHLHVVEAAIHKNRLHLNVYEMLGDHSGWFVNYQVEFDELLGVFPEIKDRPGYSFSVCDVVRGEKEEDMFMVLSIPGKMIRYSVHDKSFEQIVSFTNKKHVVYSQAHRYIESLASF